MTFHDYLSLGWLFEALHALVCEDAATSDARWALLDAAYAAREAACTP